ncbi:hypothetical protein BROUX41_004439 [Berkeleyomyces rouxiae]|uniref:uncharacterized protein n=1 Tax=Berkeleyomyces rouxiae TaxID=2035830 RepID=UPI003B76E8DA
MAGIHTGALVIGPPPLSKLTELLRYVALVVSLAELVVSSYSLSVREQVTPGQSGPAGFLIFNALFTMFVLGAVIALESTAHHMYCRFVVVTAFAVDALLWLAAWGWTACVASTLLSIRRDRRGTRYAVGLVAAASLGSMLWLLMVVIICGFISACMREPRGMISRRGPDGMELEENKPSESHTENIAPQHWASQDRYGEIQRYHPVAAVDTQSYFNKDSTATDAHEHLSIKDASKAPALGSCPLANPDLSNPAGYINVFRVAGHNNSKDSSEDGNTDSSLDLAVEDMARLAQAAVKDILEHSSLSDSSTTSFPSPLGSSTSQQWAANDDDYSTYQNNHETPARRESPPAHIPLSEASLAQPGYPSWALNRPYGYRMSICPSSQAISKNAHSNHDADARSAQRKSNKQNTAHTPSATMGGPSTPPPRAFGMRNAISEAFFHLRCLVDVMPAQLPRSGPRETSTSAMRRALIDTAKRRIGRRDAADLARLMTQAEEAVINKGTEVHTPIPRGTKPTSRFETTDNPHSGSVSYMDSIGSEEWDFKALQRRIIELELRASINELYIAHLGGQVDYADHVDTAALEKAVDVGVDVMEARREYLQQVYENAKSAVSGQVRSGGVGYGDEVMADVRGGNGK